MEGVLVYFFFLELMLRVKLGKQLRRLQLLTENILELPTLGHLCQVIYVIIHIWPHIYSLLTQN